MHSAGAAANYFLKKASVEGKGLTPIQVIKLVYIAHGWMLTFEDQPLIYENVEAWQYGPVIPTIYNQFKEFGNKPIKRLAFNYYPSGVGGFGVEEIQLDFDKKESAILNAVWENYKHLKGFQLSSLTHKEGTPWYTIWHKRGGKDEFNAKIPNSLIKEHYSNLVKQND